MTALFVLPSTSPANAAVPYAERLRWFRSSANGSCPSSGSGTGLVVDGKQRVLLVRFEHPVSKEKLVGTDGRRCRRGGVRPGGAAARAARGGRPEECARARGPRARAHVPWAGRITRQPERFYLVRVEAHEAAPTIDLVPEGVTGLRWWTLAELARTSEVVVPRELPGSSALRRRPDRP